MRLIFRYSILFFFFLLFSSCMDYGPTEEEDFDFYGSRRGLFIVNEGNFMYGNASLSFYDIDSKRIENNVFSRSNGISLGDVAQSMLIHNGLGYIVVNNSGIIFVIDVNTFKIKGVIDGLLSPRHIYPANNDLAYVTDLYGESITVFDLNNYIKKDTILTKGHFSTEQIVLIDDELYVGCWSNDNLILVVDTNTNGIIDSIDVPLQPKSMVVDINNKIWLVSDGAFNNIDQGSSFPIVSKIDPVNRSVEFSFELEGSVSPASISINGSRDTIFVLNNGIVAYDVNDETYSSLPIINNPDALFYEIAVDPVTSEIYVADAIDYVQPGVVLRYSPMGEPIDTFRVGIIPGFFLF